MANFEKLVNVSNIIALILAIIGLVFLFHNIWKNSKVNNISRWPKTNAYVLNIVAEPANGAAGNTYVDPRNIVITKNSNAEYIPRISYRYRVDNKDYESGNFIYDGKYSYNAYDTKALMEPIQPRSTISVYYNPKNHSESYVYPGTQSWMGVWTGIILLIISAVLFYFGGKKAKASAKSGSSSQSGSGIVTPNLTAYNTANAPASKFPFRFY